MGHTFARNWNAIFAFCLLCNLLVGSCAETSFEDITYPNDDSYGDENIDKRISKFVRIGKALSSFIRIGKNSPFQGAYGPSLEERNGDDLGFENDRNSALYYDDPFNYGQAPKRASSFVRIGKSLNADDADIDEVKRSGAFVRMGKFPSAAYLRNRGRFHQIVPQPYYRRQGRIGHSFIRIGKRDTTDALRAAIANRPFTSEETSGEKLDNDEDDDLWRYLPTPKQLERDDSSDGLEPELSGDKRKSSFVRIGRLSTLLPYAVSDDVLPKRKSSFVRIGKSLEEYPEKRLSSFVRIGRNILPNTDASKRMSSFVRIGKRSRLSSPGAEKRLSSFVRIGRSGENVLKRLSSFVRIGKSVLDGDVDKRPSSFVRIGKNKEGLAADDLQKRHSSFVRIGKGSNYAGYTPETGEKRMSSFVRIGKSENGLDNDKTASDYGTEKRKSSFVRIGKGYPGLDMTNEAEKRASSFVRIGKDTTNALHDNNNAKTAHTYPESVDLNSDHVISNLENSSNVQHDILAANDKHKSTDKTVYDHPQIQDRR